MNIAIFKPNQQPQYLKSVDGSEYMVDVNAKDGEAVPNDPDMLFNPDISAVANVPLKYWKRSGNNIVEMTQAEKDAIAATELQARKSAADTFAADPLAVFTALIKVINVRLSAGQKITKAELITAVKEEIV